MANKFREIQQDVETEEQNIAPESASSETKKESKPRKKGVLAKGLSSIFSGTFLTNEKNLKHLPYILFLALVAIFYIANGYYADGKIREVNKISNELKELRTEYISTKSDLMFASKQSEVAKSALALGLKEPLTPPIKIEVDSSKIFSTKKEVE